MRFAIMAGILASLAAGTAAEAFGSVRLIAAAEIMPLHDTFETFDSSLNPRESPRRVQNRQVRRSASCRPGSR